MSKKTKTNLPFLLSLLSPVVFFASALIIGTVTEGYSPLAETISMLVHTANGMWQVANFVVCGVLMVLLGVKTLQMNARKKLNVTIGRVIALFGLLMIALAIVPTDSTLIPTTNPGVVHVFFFVVAIISFSISTCKAGKATQKSNSLYSYYSFSSVVIAILGGVCMLLFPSYAGVFQRVIVFSFIVWFTVSPLFVLFSQKKSYHFMLSVHTRRLRKLLF